MLATHKPVRVAVLDGDDSLREHILLPELREHGFDPVGVGTAAELYRSLLRQRIDLVLLDIGLPDEDGISVAGHLRGLMPGSASSCSPATTTATATCGRWSAAPMPSCPSRWTIPTSTPIGVGILDANAALTRALEVPCEVDCGPVATPLVNKVEVTNL